MKFKTDLSYLKFIFDLHYNYIEYFWVVLKVFYQGEVLKFYFSI